MEIIFATTNEGKIKEIRELLKDTPFSVRTMGEAGITIEVVENGSTFEENSAKKAVEIMRASGVLTLADDSGLEIDALEGKPGVHSARYMGKDTPYSEKNRRILEMMEEVPEAERAARFVCVITAAFPDGRVVSASDTLEGIIGYEAKGNNGFGYDPIFYMPQFGMYLAEVAAEQKNAISHRGKALKKIREILLKEISGSTVNENYGSK